MAPYFKLRLFYLYIIIIISKFQLQEDANSENQPIPFSLPGQFPTLDTDTSTGRRFIRYRNSWVISHNPKGEHETIVGDGTEGILLIHYG